MEKVKKLSKKLIALITVASIVGAILITAFGFAIAFWVADTIEIWSPDYDKIDLTETLAKSELTDEDYEFLYAQTGLTKIGVDRALAKGESGKKRILNIQNDYFAEHKVANDLFAPYVCTDFIEGGKKISNSFLETGDIIVTSSTHIAGFRVGHAGLVTNGANERVIQANAYGTFSRIGYITDFTDRINFMILRPKADAEIKKQVAEFAVNELQGIGYDVTIGVFSKKDSIKTTQCSHLVWYAYNKFGIDLDSNGGLVVTPKNLANSPEVEVVQVFGFDPVKLWK